MIGDKLHERDLRAMSACALCGQPFGSTGLPLFWRVKLARYGVDLNAVRRQTGLAMMLGSPELAQVMGTDEPMATAIDQIEITVCETCAAKPCSVYELWAAGQPPESREDAG
jgi:hypothetical protein